MTTIAENQKILAKQSVICLIHFTDKVEVLRKCLYCEGLF